MRSSRRRSNKATTRAGDGEHGHPQQHRAFVVPPGAGEFVEQGLGAVAVRGDQRDRQIGAQEHGRSAQTKATSSASSALRRSRPRGSSRSGAPPPPPSAERQHSWSSDSAAASHSAARPASAIILRRACVVPAAAACNARHAWRGCCRRRTAVAANGPRRRRRCPRGTGRGRCRGSGPGWSRLPSLTVKSDGDAVGVALDRALLDHAAEPHRLAVGGLCRRRCRSGV